MKNTNIVFLLGCSRSGKDTIGEHLVNKYNYKRVSFADAVKEEYAANQGIDVSILHTQGPEKEAHRAGMIEYAESERKKNPLCWLEKAFKPYMEDVKESMDSYAFKEDLNLVITDCRRIDEIDWVVYFKDLINHVRLELEAEGQTFEPYLNIELWYVQRQEAEDADTDVLTHKCIGYARGYHRAAIAYPVIDCIISNNDTIEALSAKIDRKVEMPQEEIFI